MSENNFYIASPFSLSTTGSFARTGESVATATYYNESGVLTTASVNEPRFTYDPATLSFEGLLMESTSINKLLYSEQFDHATWIKSLITVGENSTTAPDGSIVAEIVTDAETVNPSLISQAITLASSGDVACSIYFKKGSTLASTFNCYREGDTETNVNIKFSTTGVATIDSYSNAVGIPLLKEIRNGWYRLTVVVAASASGTFQFRFWPCTRDIPNLVGSVYLWGAQAELASVSSSYIKTTTVAVTRYADVNTAALITNVLENDYSEWSSATTYALGARVIVTSTHEVYESLQASNLNHNPTTDNQTAPTYWILVSKTNRWKMFDTSNTTQTSYANKIKVSTAYTSRPNCVFFSNVEAQFITVLMYNENNDVLFDQTYKMYEDTGVPSYFSWFTNQLKRKQDLFVYPLPPIANCRISAIIQNDGSNAKCGTMLVGSAENIGLTEIGASIGIQDYSVKQRNDFGDYSILERAFNKRGKFNIFVDNSNVDRLQNILSRTRATPTLYVATSKFSSAQIYGFYKDFDIVIAYNNYSLVDLEIEGLT